MGHQLQSTIPHTVRAIKQLRAPTIRRLLREAGYTMRDVAAHRGISHSSVSRTIRKQSASEPIWASVVWLLNHPREHEE